MEEVKLLLESIGLGSYVQTFEEQGWDAMETVLTMSDDDIRTCITKPGHARKLSLKIQQIKKERKDKDEETTESTQNTKRNVSAKAEFEEPLEEKSNASEALHKTATGTTYLDKGERNSTTFQAETDLSKHGTAVMTEAGVSEIRENTPTGDAIFIEPAKSSTPGKDSPLTKMRRSCKEISRMEDIVQPEQGLVSSAFLGAELCSRETLTVCGEEIKYRGDMPQIVYIRDSKNVSIGKDVHVQRVTNQHESGYRNYKSQMNSILKSDDKKHQRLFVETRAHREALDILEAEFWVVITGNAGEGKTTMGQHLLRQHRQQGYELLIINSVEDWKNLVTGDGKEQAKQFVLIDDIFGTISVDERKVNEWASLFEMIDKLLAERNGDLKVICTARSLIYSELKTRLGRFKCFKKIRIIDLSEKRFALQENEKIKMLENYIRCYNIELDSSEIQQISTIIFSHGFPHCVKMYCTNLSLRQRGLDFFNNPIRLLENEFETLYECDKTSFFAMVMLVVAVDRNILITMYSDEDQLASLRGVAESLSNISNTTVQDIKSAFGHMKNIYINVSDDDVIRLSHPSFYELVCIVVTKHNPIAAVKFLDMKFLAYITKSHCYKKEAIEDIVKLPKSCNTHLVKRFTQALLNPFPLLDVLKHDVWGDMDFIKLWISHVTQEPGKNSECILLELISEHYLDHTMLRKEMLLSCFALNKHEQIIKAIIQHQKLQDFWSLRLGKLHLSKALISASISDCSTDLLKQLVQYGADVNYNNEDFVIFSSFLNALSCAIENNNIENAKLLLESGASIFKRSLFENSAFDNAFSNKKLDMIKLILNYMKHCTADKGFHKQIYLYGENYSHTLTSDHLSSLSDLLISTQENLSVMKDLLCNLRTSGIILSDKYLLQIISFSEQTEQVMNILTSLGYSFLNVWTSIKYSVLLKSLKDPIKSIDVFTKYGFDMNARDIDGDMILEALLLADMQEKRHSIFTYLISQGINVNTLDTYGVLPVKRVLKDIKCTSDCIDDVLKLIDLSDVDKIEDTTGKNCFHYLAMSSHSVSKDVLERLVDHLLQKGSDINKRDNSGEVPLQFCNLGMIEMFIEKGANPSITDNKKRTIPMVMVLREYQNILDILKFLSRNRLDLTVTDVRGRNILHYVGASRYNNALKEQLFAFLISKGVKINLKDKKNKTPLLVLAQNPQCTWSMIQFLIQNGASISEKDLEGFTVLHHCIRSVRSENEKLAIVESLTKDLCDDVMDLFNLSLRFSEYSVISYFLNNLKLEADCVFQLIKILINSECKADIYQVVLLLIEKYGPDIMHFLAADDDFKKALIVRKHTFMGNSLSNDLKEIYLNGINVDWFLTVGCQTIPESLSSIENVGDIIFTSDNNSPEYSLAKSGHFRLLLFFLQHRSKQWLVSEKELSKLLNSLTACSDNSTVEEVLRLLFNAKENCTSYRAIAYTTLKSWCKQSHLHPPCIKLLLEHGENVAVEDRNESLVFCVIQTYIQKQDNLLLSDVIEIVTDLTEFNFKCDLPNDAGVTPLMYLLEHSDAMSEPLVDFIISKSGNLSQADHDGNNVLHYLIISGLTDEKKSALVRMFFKHGVCITENKHGVHVFDRFFNSKNSIYFLTLKCLLHIEIEQHKLVALLLDLIRCTYIPLEILKDSFIDVFEASKLNANSIADITESTFLAQSARWLSPKLVSYFIQKGVDTNKPDILGITPIHRITLSDVLMICSVNKCIFFREDAYAELEFQRRTFPWTIDPQIDRTKNSRPVSIYGLCLKWVNDALDCLHVLLEHRADPNMMDINGKTPLHYCAESPIFDAFICPAMSLLISYGADVNLEDYKGRTPLMLCLKFEKSKYRRLNVLIKAGANLFSEDYNGRNMLHFSQMGIEKRTSWLFDNEMRKIEKDEEKKRFLNDLSLSASEA